jgi:RsmE family RNA methyltransferase
VNLLLLEPTAVTGEGVALVSGAAARHLQTVLRVGVGSTVRVGVVDGCRGVGTVRSTSPEGVRLQCTFEPSPPSRPPVDLLLGLPRPKVLRRLWAQMAALGVGRIIVTNAARVERNYFDAHVLRPESYRPLLLEGLQQAQDTRLPIVSIHRQFKVLIEDELDGLSANARRLVAHPAADNVLVNACRGAEPSRVLLAVGPEGGWNQYELELLDAHRFTRVSIGVRTLRSDTATLALLAIVHDALART